VSLALARWMELMRFFRVMPPVPSMLVGCFVAVALLFVVATLVGMVRPGAAMVPLLFVQLFAAASGFGSPARRGYFDLLLTRGERRALIAAAHWSSSVAPGVTLWCVMVGVEQATRSPPVAATTGTLAAVLLVSTLPWALTVSLPRFSGAIGWMLAIVAASAIPAAREAPAWLRFLVYPAGTVGQDVLATPLTVVPALALAAGAMVAAIVWIERMDVPLEASQ
jgi:hypothetical protein